MTFSNKFSFTDTKSQNNGLRGTKGRKPSVKVFSGTLTNYFDFKKGFCERGTKTQDYNSFVTEVKQNRSYLRT